MEASAPEMTSRTEELLVSLKLLGLFVISLMVVCHVLVAPSAPSEARLISDIGHTWFVFTATEALYVLALGVATLYTVTVIIYTATAAHLQEHDLAVEELPWRLVGTWTRFIITWVYVTLLASSYVLSAVFFIGYSATVFKDTVLRIVVLLLVIASYSYLVLVWILESVLEVLQGDFGVASDDPELQEQEGLLLEEGRCCSVEDGHAQMSSDEALVGRRKGSQRIKFWLVLAVCVVASLGLVCFGTNEDDWTKGQIVTSIISTFLFLPTELLIFVVFLVLYWGFRIAKYEKRKWSGGWFMYWFPLVVISSLLLLDQKQVLVYLRPCEGSM